MTIRSAAFGDLAIVAGLGLFQVALPYVLVSRAARSLQAPVLALLLLLEPAIAPFWAMWLHGEQPHPLTWLGGAIVALATVLLAAAVRRDRTSEKGAGCPPLLTNRPWRRLHH